MNNIPNFVTEDEVTIAREVDVISYLQRYEPEELISVGNWYSTKTHDSIRINKNTGVWIRNSTGDTGNDAISFLSKIRGYDFVGAVKFLSGSNITISPLKQPSEVVYGVLVIPEKDDNNDEVIQYLLSRRIDFGIISDCIEKNMIYQSKNYKSCVFVGTDDAGTIRHMSIRSTSTSFKQDVAGSDKRYATTFLPRDNKCQIVRVFESHIDILSFQTLLNLKCTTENSYKIPLCGVSDLKLEFFLSQYPDVKTIIISLDNDEVGQKSSRKIQRKYEKKGYQCSIELPELPNSDYNDILIVKERTNA